MRLRRFLLAHTSIAALFLAQMPWPASAQMVFDGTAGPAGAAPFDSGTSTYTIGQASGTTAGTNLFHSFNDFQIHSGETANFTGSASLTNVISRVTGPNVSNIEGTLRSSIPNADFFFVNPNGVVFGSGAAVDVPAGFHVSTADRINFSDSFYFSATDIGGSAFSVAAPQSFGFLGSPVGAISLNGATLNLGGATSLVGASISLDGASLITDSAKVNIFSAAGAGTVPIDPALLPTVALRGTITLINNATIRTLGTSGIGAVWLRGSTITMDHDALVEVRAPSTTAAGGGITIDGTSLLMADSIIAAATGTAGDAGDITINLSGNLILQAGSSITSETLSDGDAGDISITASLVELTISSIRSSAPVSSVGRSGSLDITTDDLVLQANSVLRAETLSVTPGAPTHLAINATNQVTLTGNAEILSTTRGAQDAADVWISAPTVSITGAAITGAASYLGSSGSGEGSNIEIHADTLTMTGGVSEGPTTFISSNGGTGKSGTISITGYSAPTMNILDMGDTAYITSLAGDVSLDPGVDAVYINAATIDIETGAGITTETVTGAKGGSIHVVADTLTLDGVYDDGMGNVYIAYMSSQTSGTGDAGDMTFDVGAFSMLNDANITATTFGSGRAGNITITGAGVSLENVSLTSSSFFGTGGGGTISINTTGNVDLTNSAIATGSDGDGAGGSIEITAANIFVTSANISTTLTNGTVAGTTGTVSLTADDTISFATGFISSTTLSARDAANVTLTAPTINLQDSSVIATDTGDSGDPTLTGFGRAGDVTLHTDILTINSGAIVSRTFGDGNAGDITLDAGEVHMLSDATISASTAALGPEAGSAGNIEINGDLLDIGGNPPFNRTGFIGSNTTGDGDGGSVTINATTVNIHDGAVLSAGTRGGLGHAGSIFLNVADLSIDHGQISNTVSLGGGSPGGAPNIVQIEATNSITLTHGGINSSNDNGGEEKAADILLRAPTVTLLEQGYLYATTVFGDGDAGNITINADQFSLGTMAEEASIRSSSANAGNPGNITISGYTGAKVALFEATNGHISTAYNSGAPTALDSIFINADVMNLYQTGIASAVYGSESGANIHVVANTLNIDRNGFNTAEFLEATAIPGAIATSTYGDGNAGDIILQIGDLTLTNGAVITASTDVIFGSPGIGNGGDISITGNTLSLTGIIDNMDPMQSIETTIAASTNSSGNAGSIFIEVGDIDLVEGGVIRAGSGFTGNGGSINIVADTLDVTGGAFDGSIQSGIDASTFGPGNAGSIVIGAETVNVTERGSVSARSSQFNAGTAGSITINATDILLDAGYINNLSTSLTDLPVTAMVSLNATNSVIVRGMGEIMSSTDGAQDATDVVIDAPTVTFDHGFITGGSNGSGEGSSILIRADTFSALNGSNLTASTGGPSQAGSFTIERRVAAPPGTVAQANVDNSTIATNTFDDGDAGSIFINMDELNVINGGIITATTTSTGAAGSISIGTLRTLIDSSQIATQVSGPGKAAALTTLGIQANQSLTVRNNSIISANTSGVEKASSIQLVSGTLSVETGSQIIGNTLSGADASSILILTDIMNVSGVSTISSRSDAFGRPGTIVITGWTLPIAQSLALDGGMIFATAGLSTLPYTLTTDAISINALNISMSNVATVGSGTSGAADAGNIVIRGTNLALEGSSVITSNTVGTGNAGSIAVDVADLDILSGAWIVASAGFGSADPIGAAGSIDIDAQDVLIDGGLIASGFVSSVASAPVFGAGSISIDASNAIVLANFGGISAGTMGGQDSGDITLNAPSITLGGNSFILGSTSGAAAASDIVLHTDTLTLGTAAGAGFISIDSLGSGPTGPAGTVYIAGWSNPAVQTMTIDGSGSFIHTTSGPTSAAGSASESVYIEALDLKIINSADIGTSTSGAAPGGNILVNANTFEISASSVSASSVGAGQPGAIVFEGIGAPAMNLFRLSGNSVVAASSSPFVSGPGSQEAITITANTIEILDGSVISTENWGSAAGGGIHLIGETLSVGGIANVLNPFDALSVIVAASYGAGDAGDIQLEVESVTLFDAGQILAFATGGGSGGDVSIIGDTLTITGAAAVPGSGLFPSLINASTSGGGDAGNVSVQTNSVSLVDSGQIGSATLSTGSAGSIFVEAADVLLSAGLISNAIAGVGTAGQEATLIIHASNSLTLEGGSVIDAQTAGVQDAADIHLFGETTTITNSQIIGRTTGQGQASDILVQANTLTMSNGHILSNSDGTGSPGTITLTGTHSPIAQLTLSNGSTVSTQAGVATVTSLGGGDSIFIDAAIIDLDSGASLLTSTAGAASGGVLHLKGQKLTLTGAASSLDTNTIASGNAGDMLIDMAELNVLDGAVIRASTSSSGHAGTVILQGGTLTVSGPGSALDVSAVPPANPLVPSANGGQILVQMQHVNLLNGGQLRASTDSAGNAGLLAVCCAQSVLFSGAGSGVVANSGASATGNAGTVIIKAAEVDLAQGARMTVSSAGTGKGGTIVIKANDFSVNDPALGGGPLDVPNATGVQTYIAGTAGQTSETAGDVLIMAGTVHLFDGAVISTDSAGANPAGDIEIRAGKVFAEGTHTLITSTAIAAPTQGDAGLIAIGAHDINFKDLTLQTRSETGAGGNLQLDWNGTLISRNTTYLTDVEQASMSGSAGSIYFGGVKLDPLHPETNVCNGLCENFDPFAGVLAYDPTKPTGIRVSDHDIIDASGGNGLVVIAAALDIPDAGGLPPDVSAPFPGMEGHVFNGSAVFSMPNFMIVPDDDFQSPCAARSLGRASSFTQSQTSSAVSDPTRFSPAYYTGAMSLRGTSEAPRADLRGTSANNYSSEASYATCG